MTFDSTRTMMSLTIRPVNGASPGYWFYVLRSDGAIFATWKPLPLSVSTGTLSWEHITTSPSTLVPRQIYWNTIAGALMMVGTDNHVYERTGASWTLYSNTSAVAIFGGDDGGFVTLNGTSGTSTTLSAPNIIPETPPDVGAIGGLPRANPNPDLAFSALGRTSPVSCEQVSCYALSSSNLQDLGRFEPAIYVSRFQFFPPRMTPWTLLNTAAAPEFTGGGVTGPWTIVAASGYRGIADDFFVIGGGVHLMEWIPPA
ncbi:MAG TPA: hypothetical protein VGM44_23370 [Polyangiaceae bacterium]